MSTQLEFWQSTGPTSEGGATSVRFLPTPTQRDWRSGKASEATMNRNSRPLNEVVVSGPLTSSAVVSPARTSVTPEEGQGSTGKEADCFSRPFAWFDDSDPDMCCWRTWQRCLLGGWIEYTGSWPRSVIVRNRIAYRLPPLVPRISGTGCSSLAPEMPTPKASDAERGGRGELLALVRGKKTRQKWPTPTSLSPAKDGYNGAGNSCGLVAIRKRILDENPQARGQLNADWVSILMGFPADWTVVEDGSAESRESPKDNETGSADLEDSETP